MSLSNVLTFKETSFDKKIRELSLDLVGESTKEKLERILNPGEAFFISALDSIAWLTNMRRHELPSQSTFRSKVLATRECVYLLMEHIEGEITNPAINLSVGKFSKLENFFMIVDEYETDWKKKAGLDTYKINKVFYSANSTNTADFLKLSAHFGEEKLINRPDGLVPFHAMKNPAELKAMQDSFNNGDTAIFQTISWVKENVKNGVEFSELDFYHKTNEFYKNNGAIMMKRDRSGNVVEKNTERNRRFIGEAAKWKAMALMKIGTKITIEQRQFIGHHPNIDRMVQTILDRNFTELDQHIRNNL